MPRKNLKDIAGQKFGSRTAIKYVNNKEWLTRCDCGLELTVVGAELRGRKYKCNHLIGDRFWSKVDKSGLNTIKLV